MTLPNPVKNLIDQFAHLPGLGPKSAERISLWLLRQPPGVLQRLSDTIGEAQQRVVHCSTCFSLSETDPCSVCADPNRDPSLLCVLADQAEWQVLERMGQYRGRYHLLGGALNPLQGITPESLRIGSLLQRLRVTNSPVREVILALNPDLEGESTTLYLAKLLREFPVKVSRLAKGLPTGAEIEYADEITLAAALQNRQQMKNGDSA